MQIKFNLYIAIILTFLIGMSLSLFSGTYLYFDAKSSWKNKAILQAEVISQIFSYWLDHEVKTLNNISAVYSSFPEIKKNNLQSLTRYYQYSSLLDTSTNVALINENKSGHLYIEYSSVEIELLNSQMVLEDHPAIVNMVNQLLIGNEEIVVSSIFNYNNEVYCYVATLAPSTSFNGGIIISLLPLGEILNSLNYLYLEEGLKLSIHNSLTTLPATLTQSIKGDKVFSYQQRFYHSGVDWQLDWDVYENFQGGISKSLVLTSFISGGIISFLISFIFWVLYRRNEKVNELVNERTAELEQANKYLEKAKGELVNSEKMASLGRLVAGLSHELNTPIGISLTGVTSIYDKTQSFKDKANGEGITKNTFNSYISLVEESSALVTLNLERASKLIANLKHVSIDQSSDRFRQFNLKHTIDEIVNTLNHLLKKSNVTMHVRISENIEMKSYPGALGQVFTNLIVNSITHAFKNQRIGKISIELLSIDVKTITLRYKDNGCGIAKKDIDKVFEPFFTTALSQGGSGVGLNIVYNKVNQNLQGEISLTSEVNQGVTFDIKMPLHIEEKLESEQYDD